MVKCSNCGLVTDDNFDYCPNCGNDLSKSDAEVKKEEISTYNSEDTQLNDSDLSPTNESQVEKENTVLKCKNCGSEVNQNALFCQVCGAKVEKIVKPLKRTCPNCGEEIDDSTTFCPECGANVFTGVKSQHKSPVSNSFQGQIDFNTMIKPSIVALILAIILSIIGLLIGLSWYAFIIAIILSTGLFGAAFDNPFNAIVFGLIDGLVLGLFERHLVEITFGPLVSRVYEGFFGGNLIIIMIFGIIAAYISNVYFKENILQMTDNFKGKL